MPGCKFIKCRWCHPNVSRILCRDLALLLKWKPPQWITGTHFKPLKEEKDKNSTKCSHLRAEDTAPHSWTANTKDHRSNASCRLHSEWLYHSHLHLHSLSFPGWFFMVRLPGLPSLAERRCSAWNIRAHCKHRWSRRRVATLLSSHSLLHNRPHGPKRLIFQADITLSDNIQKCQDYCVNIK